jgi:hypothetical protein
LIGEVIEKYLYTELPNGGEAIREAIARVRAENPALAWEGPSVAIAWDKELGLPLFDESRGYPALVVDFPRVIRDEVDEIANSAPTLQQVTHLRWTPFVTVLAFRGRKSVLELLAADLLPLLRLSNQGCILAVLCCADEVVVVEYGFFRQDFLELCSLLLLEPQDIADRLDGLNWTKRYSHIARAGVEYWQPIIGLIDNEDRF